MEETEDGEEAITETKYDFTEDVDALVAGEELSEEFREKAVTIFELQSPQKSMQKYLRCKKHLKLL